MKEIKYYYLDAQAGLNSSWNCSFIPRTIDQARYYGNLAIQVKKTIVELNDLTQTLIKSYGNKANSNLITALQKRRKIELESIPESSKEIYTKLIEKQESLNGLHKEHNKRFKVGEYVNIPVEGKHLEIGTIFSEEEFQSLKPKKFSSI